MVPLLVTLQLNLGYIVQMLRPVVRRFISLLVALVASMSVPGMAVLHGYAHHEAHEHGQHRSHDAVAGAVTAADESSDHAHPVVGVAPSGRGQQDAVTLAPPVTGLVVISGVNHTASLIVTAAPARASPERQPLRQPRAPPLL